MYKNHYIPLLIIFIASFLASIYTGIDIPSELAGYLLTFLSIIIGFHMTGMAILFGSSYSKKLYKEEDPKIKTQTKLQTLGLYFKLSYSSSLFTVILLLLLILATPGESSNSSGCLFSTKKPPCIQLNHVVSSFVLSMVAADIILVWLISKVFFNAFLDASTNLDT